MSETEPKRSRRGGRERRDPNAKPAAPAYITRAIPTYDILGEENLQKIEAAAVYAPKLPEPWALAWLREDGFRDDAERAEVYARLAEVA